MTRKGIRTIEKRTPRGFDPGGLKLTGDFRDENSGHVERKATGRRDRPGTRLIYSLMFLDNRDLKIRGRGARTATGVDGED